MKLKLALIFLHLTTFLVNGQTLYSKAYGNINSPAIIFIHGGPSGNSTLFEATTAQLLADKGFYVIIYDRRGEGRSIDSTATFTYQEAFNDLNEIYQTYQIKKANIIGHSFGGLVATLYSDKYPEKVKSLVLAGALFSQQDTYNHILKLQYSVADGASSAQGTTESVTAYALCYSCHNRNNIISNTSSLPSHKLHIIDQRTPCNTCHDPHGISNTQGNSTNNSNLINFRSGIVTAPTNPQGLIRFEDTGVKHGSCYLTCHGKNHNPEIY